MAPFCPATGPGSQQPVLNEIDGFDHSRAHHVGVPAIFGMNFQIVLTAEKLPSSDGLTGGYLPGGTVPGPLLVRALSYINAQVGAMAAEITARGLADSTAIIISAKHGQSPTGRTATCRSSSSRGLPHRLAMTAPIETTQIAPTIPALLGLSPSELQAVQTEHTKVLPGLPGSAAR
jgi:hypothetical protein